MAMELEAIASSANSFFDSAKTLLLVYRSVSKEDRTGIRGFLKLKFSNCSEHIEVLISKANLEISDTKRPGVAAEATRMRDDLREAKSILDSIELQ